MRRWAVGKTRLLIPRLVGIADRVVRRTPLRRSNFVQRHMAHVRIAPVGDLHEYWLHPDATNDPAAYLPFEARSRALADAIDHVPRTARVIEVGCGSGRNLAELHRRGWTDLTGVELSPDAVAVLRDHYPELRECPVLVGPAESVLPGFGPREFDVLVTLGFVVCVHPSAASVFDEMARITRTEMLLMEPDSFSGVRHYPHDIPTLFGDRGFALVSKSPLPEVLPDGDAALAGYHAFRLVR